MDSVRKGLSSHRPGRSNELLERTNALSVHLVDRSGQLITSAGRSGDFDATAFASLIAADFTANAELAQLLGEAGVEAVVSEGKTRSVYSCMLADRVIMCTVFDRRSTLGLVRFRANRAAQALDARVPRPVREGRARSSPRCGQPRLRRGRGTRGRRAVRRLTAPIRRRTAERMALINHRAREVHFKIVYYGPGLGGKTTNLKCSTSGCRAERRGRLVSIATDHERTLFFDFLPVELGQVNGFTTRFHLYTVPGQVYYRLLAPRRAAGRRRHRVRRRLAPRARAGQPRLARRPRRPMLVDARADARAAPRACRACSSTTSATCRGALPVERLRAALNPGGAPEFEAVGAAKGRGVAETLRVDLQGGARASGRRDATRAARPRRDRGARPPDRSVAHA